MASSVNTHKYYLEDNMKIEIKSAKIPTRKTEGAGGFGSTGKAA